MIVRILIDGYNLLYAWKHVAADKERYSEAARDRLIEILRKYADTSLAPITLIFDGHSQECLRKQQIHLDPNFEIIYTSSNQSADQLIERAAFLYSKYGQVLAVTNDIAIRDTVIACGGTICSCDNFLLILQNSFQEISLRVKYHNHQTNNQFNRRIKRH